jgi:hypothetical protein
MEVGNASIHAHLLPQRIKLKLGALLLRAPTFELFEVLVPYPLSANP